MDSDSMSQIITKIVIIAILILLSGFFSATETAFFSMNKIRIKSLANEGNRRAKKAMKLSENLDALLSTILIGNNLVNIATTAIATVLFISLVGEEIGPTVATVVTTIVVLMFGEITPKSLSKNSPETFAMFAAPVIQVLVTLFKPLNWLVQMWQRLVYRFVKKPDDRGVTEEELITMVEEAQNDGEIDQNESELIRNAIEFDDIEVEDIYTSRVDVIAVEVDDSVEEISEQFEKGFSRLPVYQDTIDNIIGVLNQKDFTVMKKTGQSVKNVMTDPIFVVPSMKISELLRTLQSRKSHMAIILDEFGGTVGSAHGPQPL
jgi:CBS domain containing-hemolysin-like protein